MMLFSHPLQAGTKIAVGIIKWFDPVSIAIGLRRLRLIFIVGVIFFSISPIVAQVPAVNQSIQSENIPKAHGWQKTDGYHATRQELEQIYPTIPSIEEKRDILFILLEAAFEDQEYENAYQWSNDFLQEYPNDGRFYRALFIHGVSGFQTERVNIGLQALNKFLAEADEHRLRGAAYFWRAMCKLDKGDTESAEVDVRSVYQDSSAKNYHDMALIGWALSLERRGEYVKAIELLEKFQNEFPNSDLISTVKIRLASLSLRVGYPLRSVKYLEDVEPQYPQRQEYALIRAEASLQSGRYENSQAEFKSFVKDFPESRYAQKAQYGLAWSYLKQGSYTAARREFDSLGVGSDSLAFLSLYQSAVLALLQDKQMEALTRFDTLTDRSPYDDLAENSYFQTGMLHYRAKRYREARRAFQLAARLFPESKQRTRSYRMLGETNVALGDFSNAQYAFARVRQLSGTPDLLAPSMFQEGVCLYHLGRFKSSSELFNQFLKRFTKEERTPEAYVWRGEALYQNGKYADAERSYSEALRLFPNNLKKADALYGLAWTLFEQKKFSQASNAFDRFITQYPNNERIFDATLRQADCYFFMGEYEKSSALYTSLADLKKDGQHAEYAAFQIAMSYIQRGESDRGIEHLRNFLMRFPSSLYNEVVQFNIGWTYFSKNQFNHAINEFLSLISRYPESQLMPRVLFNIGDAFYNLRQYDSARTYYQRVPKEFPTSPLVTDALQGLQYTYEAEGKPGAAVEQIDALLISSTAGISQEELLLKKGDIFFGQGDFGAAVLEYQKLMTLKPSRIVQAKACYQMARAYEMENNPQQAIKYYERVLSDFSDADITPNVTLALGLAQIKMKQFKDAVNILHDFKNKFPNSPMLSEAEYNLGIAFLNTKNPKEALNQFQLVVKNHPEDIFADRSRLQIARMHTSKKEFKTSLDTLNSLVDRRNDDLAAEALLMIGENYLSMKKPNDALQAFKDVFEQYAEYTLLVERAHLGAGECYERLRNIKQARLEYEQVVRSAIDPVIKKDAQDRLRRLGR